MRYWYDGLILALAVAVLAGCGGGQVTPAPVDVGGGEAQASAALDTSYPNALEVGGQLALGTILLEETGSGVTPQQAMALLPLWQAIQGGTLQSQAETNAVLVQVEGTMTQEQWEAIAAMQLTQEDLQAWAQDQGLSLGVSPEERAERGDQEPPAGAQPPGEGQGGGRGGLSQEEIEAMRATAEASGERAGGASASQFTILLDPLIELLTQRAAE